MQQRLLPRPLACAMAGLLAAASAAAAPAERPPQGCSATSGERAMHVVELYTSEGCSSCPPADRWLSSLKPGAGVVALAFHVDYWDRLGWADRFASPLFTQRQHEQQRSSGARFVYTPQVLLDGHDWRGWPGAPQPQPDASPVRLQLRIDAGMATATVDARGASGRLAGYWAVVEDGHVSRVAAGENAGSELRHDHVVRRYEPVAPWPAGQRQQLSWRLPADAPPAGVDRRIAFVVTDADKGRPVQALELSCAAAGS